jgi:hypothetical protein
MNNNNKKNKLTVYYFAQLCSPNLIIPACLFELKHPNHRPVNWLVLGQEFTLFTSYGGGRKAINCNQASKS